MCRKKLYNHISPHKTFVTANDIYNNNKLNVIFWFIVPDYYPASAPFSLSNMASPISVFNLQSVLLVEAFAAVAHLQTNIALTVGGCYHDSSLDQYCDSVTPLFVHRWLCT